MKNLYIDFDGVIMNTNRAITSLIEKSEIDKNNFAETHKFCSELQWDILLNDCDEISNAFFHLNELVKSGIFNVAILTHVCSDHEAQEKKNLINEKVQNLNVIPVPKEIDKCNYVNPKDSILVDDYTKNIELWEENGGIGIKFTDKDDDKFKTTYSLGEIINLI